MIVFVSHLFVILVAAPLWWWTRRHQVRLGSCAMAGLLAISVGYFAVIAFTPITYDQSPPLWLGLIPTFLQGVVVGAYIVALRRMSRAQRRR